MKDSKWSDQDIEHLLKQAPKVEDHRSKEDILKRLQQQGVITSPKKTKKQFLGLYGIATAVVAAILFGGVYTIMQSSQEEYSSMDEASQEAASTEMERSADMGQSVEANPALMNDVAPLQTAVYSQQIGETIPLTIGLAGDDAESVPVTFLLPREEVLAIFGEEPTKLALYEHYASLIDEEALGFADYHPLKGELVENGEVLTHILPDGHGYDIASATMSMYTGALIDTFAGNYREVAFIDEAGGAIEFSQAGEPSEPLPLQKYYSYFLDEQPAGIFLAPNFRQTFGNVTEALQSMKVEDNDVYQSAILEGADFTVQDGEVVTVSFTEPLDLERYDAQQAMWMMEAILLTAAGFHKQVQFENIVQTEWQGFIFNEQLPLPIGANLLSNEYVSND